MANGCVDIFTQQVNVIELELDIPSDTVLCDDESLNLVAENETEEKLLKEIEKTIVNKIKRLKTQQHSVNIETDQWNSMI